MLPGNYVVFVFSWQDPQGNFIEQWLSIDSHLGVVSKEFQLSDNPPLGSWTIEATVDVSLTLI